MDAITQARYQARARIVKAMAHPTRLFIVDELCKHGEKCVCELTRMIGADMSTVSRHLAALKNAGLVHDEKRGCRVYYQAALPEPLRFFDCVEAVMASNARTQRGLLS